MTAHDLVSRFRTPKGLAKVPAWVGGIFLVLTAAAAAPDKKEPVEEKFAKFLMVDKAEYAEAFATMLDSSNRQRNIRGLNDDQRKCIDEYIDETKDQMYRFRKATDDIDYEEFASMVREEPKKARELAEKRWKVLVEVSTDSVTSLKEEQECLVEAGGRFPDSARGSQ